MKNNHQLILENWGKFLSEQVEPVKQQPQQTNPINLIKTLAKQKPESPNGPSQETVKTLKDQNTIKNLKAAIASNKILDAFNLIIKSFPKDSQEIAKAADVLIPQLNSTKSEKTVNEKKQLGPIANTLKITTSALSKLGGGSIENGLGKFSGTAATITLGGMILANLANAYTTKNVEFAKEALELIDLLQKSLSLSKSGDLIQFISDVSQPAIKEAKYQGRTVPLNKPMKGDVKKSKVNFGDKNMKIKKSNPKKT